jgi:glycosyltransferase involved in cell wall biosynthesis
VTILMSVHNDRRYLAESVGSILAQTLDDFEFLIIDDGSGDGSAEVLRAVPDPRVRLLENERNLGLTHSLNIGLDHARGRYVARMDADDIAESMRLESQVSKLEREPDLGLLGTGRMLINDAGETINIARPASGRGAVLWKMLLGNAFAHPTVMLRRDVLERYRLRYDEQFQTAQDYELWVRVLQHCAGDNLPEPLVRYRLRDGISRTRKPDQLANHDRIALQAIRSIVPGFQLTLSDVTQLRSRFGGFSVREAEMQPTDEPWATIYASLRAAFDRRNRGADLQRDDDRAA